MSKIPEESLTPELRQRKEELKEIINVEKGKDIADATKQLLSSSLDMYQGYLDRRIEQIDAEKQARLSAIDETAKVEFRSSWWVQAEKQKLLQGLRAKLQCDTEEEVRKKLASNQQFAKILEELHIPVPMKESNTTGKETFALAKTDEGFLALQEHEDPFVQDLCAVRLGTKSTIEESRIERFINIARRNHGFLPIPLKYYGAHTGRWAGADKVNFQNLPSRDVKKKALKNAIKGLISVIENSEENQDSGIAYRYITKYEDHLKRLVK